MLDLEGASFGNFAFPSGWLGENVLAVIAGNDWLGVAEHNIGFAASSAFDVHEVGVRSGDESLKLVGLALLFDGGVQKVSVHVWMRIIIIKNWYIKVRNPKGEKEKNQLLMKSESDSVPSSASESLVPSNLSLAEISVYLSKMS